MRKWSTLMLDISEECGEFSDDARFGTIGALKNLELFALFTNKNHIEIPGIIAGKIDKYLFWIIPLASCSLNPKIHRNMEYTNSPKFLNLVFFLQFSVLSGNVCSILLSMNQTQYGH